MYQDIPARGPEDEAREEDVIDQLVHSRTMNEADDGASAEERQAEGELDYQDPEGEPRSSGESADLDNQKIGA